MKAEAVFINTLEFILHNFQFVLSSWLLRAGFLFIFCTLEWYLVKTGIVGKQSHHGLWFASQTHDAFEKKKNLQEKSLKTSHYECISVHVKEKAHLAFYGHWTPDFYRPE